LGPYSPHPFNYVLEDDGTVEGDRNNPAFLNVIKMLILS